MFTLDTDSGFRDVVFITAGYGLGETLVQGSVNPDEFYVYKPALAAGRSAILRRTLGTKALKMIYAEDGGATPVTTVEVPAEDRRRFCISDAEVEELARQAMRIEKHYGCPMDIEWAKDGVDGRLRIVQARPETVQSRSGRLIERFTLEQSGRVITTGRSIGHKIGSGPARVVESVTEIGAVRRGDVLVTDMTDPDWEPVMKRAAAIVTNRGGRTCHAAIMARELGIPAVVGCGDATDSDQATARTSPSPAPRATRASSTTVCWSYDTTIIELGCLPEIPVKIMMNVGNPDRAFDFAASRIAASASRASSSSSTA